jgi:selenocysteine lyase/cysteine desulfurase
MTSFDVRELRAQEFPWTSQATYLNNASIGPLPARTVRVLADFNSRRAELHRLEEHWFLDLLVESRRLAGQLLNVPSGTIALATNTSFGLNIAAQALPFAPDDIVLVSDREFPANVYPWMALRSRGVKLELAQVTPEGWPDEDYLTARMADPQVKALAVSLVQFSNGYRVDLGRLSRGAAATGTWLVVDAIQGLGHLPVDLAETPVDILSCGAQKWLCSPWGSGFFHVRESLIEQLTPPMAGWMAYEGTDDFTQLTRYREELRSDARRFEVVTLPYQDFAGMNSSLGLLLELGLTGVSEHVLGLRRPIEDWADRRGIPLASPRGAHASGIICVTPPEPARCHQKLREAGIICSLREGSIRLSPHGYNTLEEMERVVEVLDREVRREA